MQVDRKGGVSGAVLQGSEGVDATATERSLVTEPTASAIATRLGDVAGIVAALMLKANENCRRSASLQRDIASRRQDSENQRQLNELSERADRIFWSGIATGITKAGSGVMSFEASRNQLMAGEKKAAAEGLARDAKSESTLGAEEGWQSDHFTDAARLQNLSDTASKQAQAAESLQRGLDLGAKLDMAGSELTGKCFDSLEAENDERAKRHEQGANAAGRLVDDTKDRLAQLDKLTRDVISFVQEFERTIASAQSAAWHKA